METTGNDLEKLTSMIKDIKFAMLTTISEDGSLHSRPMVSQDFSKVQFDGTLWFFSRKGSLKNHAIGHEQHVNIAYANPEKQRYVSVNGTATISEDKEKMKELWSSEFSTWFPQGLEDPEISLIGVHVDSAEIWDSLPNEMVQLAGKPFNRKSEGQHIDIQTQQ